MEALRIGKRLALLIAIFSAALVLFSPTAAAAGPENQPSVSQNLQDLLFDFDKYQIPQREEQTLRVDADWLKQHPNVEVRLAGYADIRGDIVYNLALSQLRAAAVKQALVDMGIAEDRITYATGWGELYPVCSQATEDCWAQNRRVTFVPDSAPFTLSAASIPHQ